MTTQRQPVKALLTAICVGWAGLCLPLTGPAWAVKPEVITPVLSETLNAVLRDHQAGQFATGRYRLYQFLRQSPQHPVATAALADLYLRELQLYQLAHLTLPAPEKAEKARIQAALNAAWARYSDHPRLVGAYQRWMQWFDQPIDAQTQPWEASYQPGHVRHYQQWALEEMTQKHWHNAKQIALVALELNPKHAENYLLMAELLLATEHPTEAERFAQQAEAMGIAANPKVQGRLLALQNGLKEAVLDTALPNPQDPTEQTEATDPMASIAMLLAPLANQPLACSLTNLHSQLRLAHTEAERGAVWQAITSLAVHKRIANQGSELNPGLLNQYQAQLRTDMQQPLAQPDVFQLSLERLRWVMGQPAKWAPLAQSKQDMVAGLALFMQGDIAKANERLDAVDGETPEGYQQVGQTLLLHHALTMAETMTRRGLQMGNQPGLQATLSAIAQQQAEARKAVQFGDVDARRKDWSSAVTQYQKATVIYPEWEAPYLRMGELYRKRKQPGKAYTQFSQAIKLNPGMLSSPGFSKMYRKLEKQSGQGNVGKGQPSGKNL
jgi:tetratricopeptide (TPR) repeat protein